MLGYISRLPLAGIIALFACFGCPLGGQGQTTLSTSQPPHHIGVRTVDGIGEFFDTRTGLRFIPRGNNYVRLSARRSESGKMDAIHATFDPGSYDTQRTEAALIQMSHNGYNIVRVFLNETAIAGDHGLSKAYLRNVADFLSRAQQHNIYTILTLDWLPPGKYTEILKNDCCADFALHNLQFLSASGLRSNVLFFHDLIDGLRSAGAPLAAIFAYELRNEFFYDSNYPPLSLSSGVVKTADGLDYDLSDPSQKENMLENNLVVWINTISDEIKNLDSSALVTVGFFQPNSPNPTRAGDPRFVIVSPAPRSRADFIDLHMYPGLGLDLGQYMENFDLGESKRKPLLMGEFGALEKKYADASTAAKVLKDWEVASCLFRFSGWLLWTWDTSEQNQFYSATDDEGQINGVLAPTARPDPCAADRP